MHPAFSAEEIYHLQKIAKYQTKIHLARNATLDKESIESLLLNAVYTAAEQLCAHPSLDEIYISAIIEQNDESYH